MTERVLSCAETLDRLDDYLDRELSPAELAEVERHLEHCLVCAGEFHVERDVMDCIRARLAQVRMPADVRERLAQRLGQARPPG